MPRAPSGPSSTVRWVLIGLVTFQFLAVAIGIRQNLPYAPEVDEPIFVGRAVHIASSGDLNPGWFGNPGSTVIYPLAAMYHLWYAGTHQGMLWRPDPNLQASFDASFAEYYLLGRLLTLAYAVMCVPLIYHVGALISGPKAGLLGAGLSVLSSLTLYHSQVVRTDIAGEFFGLLSLYLCLRLLTHYSLAAYLLAGGVIGLGISTRYFLAAMLPVLLLVGLLVIYKRQRSLRLSKAVCLELGSGLLVAPLAFAASSPFFFLSFQTALHDLAVEARSNHLGADGLPPLGNLWWYATSALPQDAGWPQLALSVIGVVLAIRRRALASLLLIVYGGAFLGGTVLSPLHWARWLIPILPLFSLLAAYALVEAVVPSLKRLSREPRLKAAMPLLAVLLVSVWPAYQLARFDISKLGPSTRIQAREWLVRNLPGGSKIAQESYGALLAGTSFVMAEEGALPAAHTLAEYREAGYQYLIASSYMYERYLAEPSRYVREATFYHDLFSRGRLIQQFEGSLTSSGPTIRVYDIRAP